jgi:hypothetical protein
MPIQGKYEINNSIKRNQMLQQMMDLYTDMIGAIKNVKPQYSLPDLTAEYRYGRSWGYKELAGLLRKLKWKDLDTSGIDYSGQQTGWGLNLSSGIKLLKQDMIHLQLVYGKGIENYIRDAPQDIAVRNTNTNSIEGVALPIIGFVGFYDHYWNNKFTSTIGYSSVTINNSNGQAPNAFKMGGYAITNFIYTPVKDVMLELELQFLDRKNFSDGWTTTDPRIQFSFRFNFSKKFYHELNTTP